MALNRQAGLRAPCAVELQYATMRGLTTSHAAVARARRQAGRWRRELKAGPGFESRMVWILGSPRSGSSWLLNLFAEQEPVVPIDEPLVGMYLSPFLSDLPGWTATGIDSRNFSLRRVQEGKTDQFFALEFENVWRPLLRDLIFHRFLAHADRYHGEVPLSKTVLAIKEPNGSQSADMIMSALPAARLLFLLRDGRDVVDSELAANSRGAWATKGFPGGKGVGDEERLDFVVQSAHKWIWRTEVVQEAFAAHPGPKLLVRYEDLRADPKPNLRALFAWAGLEIDEARLSKLVEEHAFERIPVARVGSDKFARAATPGLWRENLTAAEQAAVGEVLDPKLRELGYEV
jgi:hypothetical protein